MAEYHDFESEPFENLCKRLTQHRIDNEDNRSDTFLQHFLRFITDCFDYLVDLPDIEKQLTSRFVFLQVIEQTLLGRCIECQQFDDPILVFVEVGNDACKSGAYLFDDQVDVFGVLGDIGDRFENRDHIFDRNLFVEQLFEYPLDQSQRSDFECIFDDNRVIFFDFFQKCLNLLARQKILRMFFDQFAHVGRNDGRGVDDGIPFDDRFFLFVRIDPDGIESEGRLLRMDAFDLFRRHTAVHGKKFVCIDLPASDFDPFEQYLVYIGRELQVVPYTHLRHQKSIVGCDFPTHASNTLQQIASPARIGQFDELIAEIEFQHLHFEDIFECSFLLFFGWCRTCRRCRFFFRTGCTFPFRSEKGLFHTLFSNQISQPQEKKTDECKRKGRKARDQSEEEQNKTDDKECFVLPDELIDRALGEVFLFVFAGTGDDDTGSRRNDESRDLRYETVTDRQKSEGLGRVGKGHAVLKHSDQKTADDIDDRDDDTRDRVTLDEFARTVHRAVEAGFLQNFGAPCFRFVFVDETGIEVGIDRHLFAGHRVKGKTCSHFGDACRTFGDDDEVDNNDNREDDNTDDIIAANDKITKTGDDVADCFGSLVSLG